MVKRKTILCGMYYLSIFFLVFLCELYAKKQENLLLLSNNLYTSNARVLSTISLDKISDSTITKAKEYRIFIDYNENIRYFKQIAGTWEPPMLQGRFFKENEIGKKAVIGKNYIEKITEQDGKNYINILNDQYEVIGIIGAQFSSAIDYLILLNLEDINHIQERKIVVDTSNKSNINTLNKYFSGGEENLMEKKGITRIQEKFPFAWFVRISSYMVALVGTAIYLILWYEENKEIRYVMYMLGVNLNKEYIKSIVKLSTIVTIAALIPAFIIFVFEREVKLLRIGIPSYVFLLTYTTIILTILYMNERRQKFGC